jgi:hypothetical protein
VLSSPELSRIEVGEPETFAEHLQRPCAAAAAAAAASTATVGPNGSGTTPDAEANAALAASVAAFANLGGDATLVAPCPLPPSLSSNRFSEPEKGYPHLASFLRRAPAAQVG